MRAEAAHPGYSSRAANKWRSRFALKPAARGRSKPCSRSHTSKSTSSASRGRCSKPVAAATAPDRQDQPSQPGRTSHIANDSGPMCSATPARAASRPGRRQRVPDDLPPRVTARPTWRTTAPAPPRCRFRSSAPLPPRASRHSSLGRRAPVSAQPACRERASALRGLARFVQPSARPPGVVTRSADQAGPRDEQLVFERIAARSFAGDLGRAVLLPVDHVSIRRGAQRHGLIGTRRSVRGVYVS